MDRPPTEISGIEDKESVTVSIATISGWRNFPDIFSTLERLHAENFVKIGFLGLELSIKIREISVSCETWHPQDPGWNFAWLWQKICNSHENVLQR